MFLDPPFGSPALPNGRRSYRYVIHKTGQKQKVEVPAGPVGVASIETPTVLSVDSPSQLQTEPNKLIDMTTVYFEVTSNSTGDVTPAFSKPDPAREMEILNFKVFPGVILSQQKLKQPHIRRQIDGNPLDLKYHSVFVDTRLASFNFVAFDFIGLRDRIVSGVIPQPEPFSGAFTQSPATGIVSLYSRLSTDNWESRQTGYVTSMWFCVNQVSSSNDKLALSRLMFAVVVLHNNLDCAIISHES